MNINTISGIDIDRRWLLHGNDLLLVDGYDNLFQAIRNRLSCKLDDMAYFYDGYGSRLRSFLGQPLQPSVLQGIANEVVRCLSNEPRLSECKCDVARSGQNNVLLKVTGIIDEDDDFEFNFLLDPYTQSISNVGWNQTQLELHIGLWDCQHQDNVLNLRRGESILIQCRVLNQDGNLVPIGVVDYFIGGVHRSVEVENGRADLLFDFPEYWNTGEYTIEAHYRGIGKFSPATDTLTITLNEQWETITKFRHENNYGIPWQEVMFPVSVRDVVNGKVRSGEVHYSLNWTERLRTRLNASNMYTTTPTKGKAVWSKAIVYDEWDNYAKCGCINFYIDNLDGMLKATKTILENGFILDGTNHTYLHSFTYDEDYNRVCGGKVNFSYREMPQILDTITQILDENLRMSVGHQNRVNTLITDEDGIGAINGDVDYSVRKCGRCSPYDTFTTTNDTYKTVDNKAFTHSKVVDEDDLGVPNGDIAYSIDDLPLAVTTHDIEAFSNGARYGAMIVDMNDNIIDAGSIVTSNGITNYVSDPDENNDKSIKLKLTGVDK